VARIETECFMLKTVLNIQRKIWRIDLFSGITTHVDAALGQ
jgi:hypothetical protein